MDGNNKVFKFQGSSMIVHAKGPNIDKTINMSSSFRANPLSSTLNMPRNFEKHSYAESYASERSLYYRRETSPTASVRSEFQPRNFYQSFRQEGYSQRSTYNGREGSPASLRSTVSVTGMHIKRLIKNAELNECELRSIQLELEKKTKRNRKAKRRRKIRRYFENINSGSGYDSGEQGSNSSISSDDCTSTRSGFSRYNRNYKENIPQSTSSFDLRLVGRDIRTDFRENNMNRDHSYIDRENPYRKIMNPYPKNMLLFQKDSQIIPGSKLPAQNNSQNTLFVKNNAINGPKTMGSSQRHVENAPSMQRNTLDASICSAKSLKNMSMSSLKSRFQSGYQFPSQRFNYIMPFSKNDKVKSTFNKESDNNGKETTSIDQNSDENDDIFQDTTIKPVPVPRNNVCAQKRNIECLDGIPTSASKKCKKSSENKKPKQKTQAINNSENNDFIFAKPQFPIRKFAVVKPQEELILKSAGIFTDMAFNKPEKNIHMQSVEPIQEKETDVEVTEATQLTTSDMSMRPSFMKRKLFTQTLDVTERKNNSSDSLATDSPQSNIYSAVSREKHKTRKLVPSQSLLSRDVNQDDNNLLDLIHKIVPPSQVNTTNVARKTSSRVSGNKTSGDGDDKWDITSIISTCNDGGVSDTYTDEEIFKVSNDAKKNRSRAKANSNSKPMNIIDDGKKSNNKPETIKCQDTDVNKKPLRPANSEIKTSVNASLPKKIVPSTNRIDAFWDTDMESDYECAGTPQILKNRNITGTSNNTTTPKQSSIKSNIEVRPNNSSVEKPKITNTPKLIPFVVLNNDLTLLKDLKKQTSKQMLKNTSTKTIKTCNEKSSLPDKSGIEKRISSVRAVKTRRQINLSSTSTKLVEKSQPEKPVTLPSKSILQDGSTKKTKTTKSTAQNVTKTQSPSERTKKQRNKSKTNTNQQDNARSETQPENIKTRREPKNSKLQKHDDSMNNTEDDAFCKILRSRCIDLSSSFNSDQFELKGISRVRKSRTPSKRISFNKSKNKISDCSRKKITTK